MAKRGSGLTLPPQSGAEWLVGVGFRCWLAGYDTGDIACWENGWNEYARALGTERAKRAVTELACWVRAVRATASRKIEYYPVRLRGLLRRRVHGDLADRGLPASPLPGDAGLCAGAHRLGPGRARDRCRQRLCRRAARGRSAPVVRGGRGADGAAGAREAGTVSPNAAKGEATARGVAPERPPLRRRLARLKESGNLGWSAAAFLISLIALLPILAIAVIALQPSGDTWPHLIANVLPGALRRTLGSWRASAP